LDPSTFVSPTERQVSVR